jgi:hypothetical protein
MELTKEQVLQIDNYIYSCGIKFYDVRAEIVDHFANILENKLEENPNLDFKKEIITIHKNFSDKGFNNLLEEKRKSVYKKFIYSSLKKLVKFFKFPKIIISGGLFYALFLIMNLFNNKEVFFEILVGIGMLIMIQLFVRILIRRKQKKEQFLSLERTDTFLQIINFLFILFNTTLNFRQDKSFLNDSLNLIHLAFFVLVLLFYWSGEYVYYQNKEEVKKQYPNVIV